MRANESSPPPPPPPFPSCSPPAQPKQRPAVGLIIKSNGQDSGPVCTNTQRRSWEGKGNRLAGGWGFNKRQPASALFGLQIIAGWCSIILQPKIAVERKVEGEEKERESCEGGKKVGDGGRKRNSGRAPKGKKGLVNTIIIFKNITGAAAA